MDRYDVLIGAVIGIVCGIVLIAYFWFVFLAIFWILDVVNGKDNPLDLLELLGLIIILASIFGGSSTVVTVKKGEYNE